MSDDHIYRSYPELRVGGFTRVDATIAFYTRVQALLLDQGPQAIVLDFGAGRGAHLEDSVPYRQHIRRLGGAATVIGLDIDPVVLSNSLLDEAYTIEPGKPFPLLDASVDLIVSDFTFEHIVSPVAVAKELDRVLRPGGWICARTPNRRGYIGLAARAIPNSLHRPILRHLQPERKPEDVFPTAYRLNTRKDIARSFPPGKYDIQIIALESEPAYVGRSSVAVGLMSAISHLIPPRYRSILLVFLQKVR